MRSRHLRSRLGPDRRLPVRRRCLARVAFEEAAEIRRVAEPQVKRQLRHRCLHVNQQAAGFAHQAGVDDMLGAVPGFGPHQAVEPLGRQPQLVGVAGNRPVLGVVLFHQHQPARVQRMPPLDARRAVAARAPLGQVPQYAADMLALLAQLHANSPITRLDWVGTSMGGLIGMAVAGTPDLALPVPIRRLLLNDVGPRLEWSALQRIGTYVGQSPRFASVEEGAAWLRVQSADFGPHTDAQWLALSEPMLRPGPEGGFVLHYDPKIAVPMQGMTQEQVVQGEALLWNLYDAITAQTLVLRGAKSDLLTAQTVQEMAQRGPKAHSVTLECVGHAPTLVQPEQVALVKEFLFR